MAKLNITCFIDQSPLDLDGTSKKNKKICPSFKVTENIKYIHNFRSL